MAIDFQHKEYKNHIDQWDMIDKVCEGVEVDEFLIPLNPDDKSTENTTRNSQYKERAVFYPISGRTAEGLVSLMFSKKPKLEVPESLEYMGDNCDGAGVSIYQQSQDLAGDVVKVARGGLFTTYPKVDQELSKADMDTGNFYATIHEIEAQQIINWRVEAVGALIKLSLVVFTEEIEELDEADGYEVKCIEQIRELSLIDGVFHVTTWRKDEKDEWIVHEAAYAPTDGYGKVWDVIPFTFVGSSSNSSSVDDSIMYGMSKLNIAHYRNSADYEDSVWYAGQAQPWMSGVDQSHVELMKEGKMYIGSRQLMGVPTGETFAFASADPNPMVRQAMNDKLDGMIGMGARYITQNKVEKREVEALNDNAVSHSTLSMISQNVGEAYTQCLEWAARYMKAPAENILYQPETEFVQPTATAQEIQQMVSGFISGAIPMSDYFAWLKKMDLVDKEKSIEEFAAEVDTVKMPPLDEA